MKMKPPLQTPRTLTRNAILLAITALALAASSSIALAEGCIAQTTWIDGNGNWFTPSNWDNGVPTASAAAQINNGGTANINSAGAQACNLTLGFNATDSGNVFVNAGGLTVLTEVEVGAFGKGTLRITNGGTVSAGLLTIAALSSGSAGTVTVDGSTFTISGRCDVGGDNGTQGGVALLSVTNSGTVSASNVHVYKSGTLTGNGTVSTTNANGMTVDGTVSRTVGTLTIGGNVGLTSTATTQCSVTPQDPPNQADISVSGRVSLDGRLSVTMTGTFTCGTQFTLLYAAGGIDPSHPKFSSYSITYPTGQGFSPQITYDANHVYLVLACNTGP